MSDRQKFGDLHDFAARSSDGPVVVDFTGSYCPPCRQLAPILARLAEEYRGRVQVVTVDVEDRPDVGQRYGVRSVPTLLVFKDGQVIAQQVGLGSTRRLKQLFADAVAVTPTPPGRGSAKAEPGPSRA